MEDHCHIEPMQTIISPDEQEHMELALLTVSGMGCHHCANRVRNSLLSLPGAVDAYVDHTGGVAQVTFNPRLVTVDDLVGAVLRAGGDGRHEYRARLLATALSRPALTKCSCCDAASSQE